MVGDTHDTLTVNQEDPLTPIHGPEIFIGLVGPSGTDLDLLSSHLSKTLKNFDYKCHVITVSDIIKELRKFSNIPDKPEDARITKLIKAGTEIKETVGRGDILALLSIAKIRELRFAQLGEEKPYKPLSKVAYIFRSLKNPQEVQTLREIYGRPFYLISAYSPRDKRVENLTKRIADSHNSSSLTKYREAAENITVTDELEEGKKHGQNVSGAFPIADFFVNVSRINDVKNQVERIIKILFGFPFETPQKDEMGMYLAWSSSLRSSDLSRQVGAVIMSDDGEVLSTGCNDVPKFGGGQYWPDDTNDERDFQKGSDSNAIYKNRIIKEIVDLLYNEGAFDKKFGSSADNVASRILGPTGRSIFGGAQVFNLIEFGRAVHAEMAAITNAVRRGVSLQNSILYCTTFPCHNG
ncbi:MAG: dCMP deaminase [Alphaproteobacteria bacterium]|nr:dCMP deaminase [Alphaproteobacteria bacterium]